MLENSLESEQGEPVALPAGGCGQKFNRETLEIR